MAVSNGAVVLTGFMNLSIPVSSASPPPLPGPKKVEQEMALLLNIWAAAIAQAESITVA